MSRLTACILHSVASATQLERRLRVERLEAAQPLAGSSSASSTRVAKLPPPGKNEPPQADIAAALRGVRDAGVLFPGQELVASAALRDAENVQEVEADLLRKQVGAWGWGCAMGCCG